MSQGQRWEKPPAVLSPSTSRREKTSTELPKFQNPQITVRTGEQREDDPLNSKGFQEALCRPPKCDSFSIESLGGFQVPEALVNSKISREAQEGSRTCWAGRGDEGGLQRVDLRQSERPLGIRRLGSGKGVKKSITLSPRSAVPGTCPSAADSDVTL